MGSSQESGLSSSEGFHDLSWKMSLNRHDGLRKNWCMKTPQEDTLFSMLKLVNVETNNDVFGIG